MICGLTYYEIFLYFLIYSVLGWMTEVAYHGVTQGKVINRGFLNGPVCPVYGFGVLAVFMGLDLFAKAHQIETLNGFGIFFAGAMLFLISDIVLILNTFGPESRFSLRITNLTLYYIGQILIAVSLLFL